MDSRFDDKYACNGEFGYLDLTHFLSLDFLQVPAQRILPCRNMK